MKGKKMIKHLSCSSVGTYGMCPRKWKYRYIQKAESKVSVNLVFGSAFHDTIEDVVKSNGKKQLLDRWPYYWKKQQARQTSEIEWNMATPEAMLAVGKRMFKSADAINLINSLRPLVVDGVPQIETKISFKIPDVPIPIIGFVDIITDDHIPGDFKTAQRKWPKDKAKKELQPLIYLAGLKKMGRECPGNRFRHYVFIKSTGDVQVFENQFSDEKIEWGLEVVRQTWYGIRASAYPASTGGWWCSEKWCEYWDQCQP